MENEQYIRRSSSNSLSSIQQTNSSKPAPKMSHLKYHSYAGVGQQNLKEHKYARQSRP